MRAESGPSNPRGTYRVCPRWWRPAPGVCRPRLEPNKKLSCLVKIAWSNHFQLLILEIFGKISTLVSRDQRDATPGTFFIEERACQHWNLPLTRFTPKITSVRSHSPRQRKLPNGLPRHQQREMRPTQLMHSQTMRTTQLPQRAPSPTPCRSMRTLAHDGQPVPNSALICVNLSVADNTKEGERRSPPH
jgi:hypothetical protein